MRINSSTGRPFDHDDTFTGIDELRPADDHAPATGADDGTFECAICGEIIDTVLGIYCEHAQVNEDDGKEGC